MKSADEKLNLIYVYIRRVRKSFLITFLCAYSLLGYSMLRTPDTGAGTLLAGTIFAFLLAFSVSNMLVAFREGLLADRFEIISKIEKPLYFRFLLAVHVFGLVAILMSYLFITLAYWS